jgi:hypothetical protein
MKSDQIKTVLKLLLGIVFIVSAASDLQAKPDRNLLDASITAALKEEGLTGAAWATRHADGHVVFGQTGYRDAEKELSFLPDSKFHVGSVTKTLLATGILRLVSTGKIKLDYPVSFYLRELPFDNPWAPDNPVTICPCGFGLKYQLFVVMLAYLTRILLLSISLPFSCFIAALASPLRGISTKAKPLEPPVFLSSTRVQDCTAPQASNNARSSFSEVVRARLRINSFMSACRLTQALDKRLTEALRKPTAIVLEPALSIPGAI